MRMSVRDVQGLRRYVVIDVLHSHISSAPSCLQEGSQEVSGKEPRHELNGCFVVYPG